MRGSELMRRNAASGCLVEAAALAVGPCALGGRLLLLLLGGALLAAASYCRQHVVSTGLVNAPLASNCHLPAPRVHATGLWGRAVERSGTPRLRCFWQRGACRHFSRPLLQNDYIL